MTREEEVGETRKRDETDSFNIRQAFNIQNKILST